MVGTSNGIFKTILFGACAAVVGSTVNVLLRSRVETDARHRQQIWYAGYAAGLIDKPRNEQRTGSVVPLRSPAS